MPQDKHSAEQSVAPQHTDARPAADPHQCLARITDLLHHAQTIAQSSGAERIATELAQREGRLTGVKEKLVNYSQEIQAVETAREKVLHDIRNVEQACQILIERVPAEQPAVREALLALNRGLGEFAELLGRHSSLSRDSAGYASNIPRRFPEVLPARILIAEDDQATAKYLAQLLQPEFHKEVAIVHSGSEVVPLLHERDFDLVLLDVQMPGMTGTEVLRVMRNRGSPFQHVPVIMVSGGDRRDIAVQCIADGADDYLTKPVNPLLLAARVAGCLVRRQTYKKHLRQFFSTALCDRLHRELALGDLENAEILKTRENDITVLFCDIRRFSAISGKLEASATVTWVRSVMEELAGVVDDYQGVVIDIIGDELMVMWGAPRPAEGPNDHADQAVKAGLDLIDKADQLSSRWSEQLGEPFRVGVGINSGKAQVGVIGPSSKFKYGPLGPMVNLASRVQGVTKHLKASLVVTEHTMAALHSHDHVATRLLGTARLVNIANPVRLFEIGRSHPDSSTAHVFERYEQAWHRFEQRDCRSAAQLLASIVAEGEPDGPSQLLMSRVLSEMVREDEKDFDPVWTFGKG